ncbi:hypothetical protein [Paenibacillus tarimensis]|uniref:hypothetical protein n=1 Tax=Paenibacillus tarimensis TaxID=416012 RepID=UPI001F3872F6|nr:hypothetical protein [Paenibacillus tarimensis]
MIVCVTISFLLSSTGEEAPQGYTVNEHLIESKSFSISSISSDVDTSVEGTVFVKGREESPDYITIVAAIEIDPEDWGGVALYP